MLRDLFETKMYRDNTKNIKNYFFHQSQKLSNLKYFFFPVKYIFYAYGNKLVLYKTQEFFYIRITFIYKLYIFCLYVRCYLFNYRKKNNR